MTEPDLSPEQDAVRRLLADARHDGATPPEVVARLDETLAGLVEERAAQQESPVVALADRRRRRASLLLAAAAVVVAGVGVSQVLPRVLDGGGDSMSASDTVASEPLTDAVPDELKEGGSAVQPRTQESLIRLDPATLQDDLVTLRAAAPRLAAGGTSHAVVTCAGGPEIEAGRGQQIAVRLDGRSGIAVFRTPTPRVQVVEVYVCGEELPPYTVDLPAP